MCYNELQVVTPITPFQDWKWNYKVELQARSKTRSGDENKTENEVRNKQENVFWEETLQMFRW